MLINYKRLLTHVTIPAVSSSSTFLDRDPLNRTKLSECSANVVFRQFILDTALKREVDSLRSSDTLKKKC